jgi:hypothetical protein
MSKAAVTPDRVYPVVETITDSQAVDAKNVLALYELQLEEKYENLPKKTREKLDEALEGIASSYGSTVQEARDRAVSDLLEEVAALRDEFGDEMVYVAMSANGGVEFSDELETEYTSVQDVVRNDDQCSGGL